MLREGDGPGFFGATSRLDLDWAGNRQQHVWQKDEAHGGKRFPRCAPRLNRMVEGWGQQPWDHLFRHYRLCYITFSLSKQR